ncbi:succinate dehydrogenase, hydrophobic membrane anchor protein [Robiginitomaculum antarcticum]|uniref:succinate dehydrogenase, hydrophobic membrane anchor protein n=1 Tax=Robiginitomaculum antarcticum TaxID=437507 RepID=UPI000382016A|nr:succinate dehydrogenase, hydrophobic membrane anchor protein [Robiginitomaculum antarcticum]
MSQDFRTDMSRVKGHGSAHNGTHHFIAHRVSAIILAITVPFLVWGILSSAPDGFDGFLDYIETTFGALTLLLFVTAAFFHGRSGLTEVILDYTSGGTRMGLLLAVTLISIGFWLLAVLSIFRIWLGA